MATYVVLARNADYSIAGQLPSYTIDASVEFNAVGSIAITVPLESCPAGWPDSGSGVVVIRDGEVWASGTWDEETFSWSADPGGEDAGAGNLALTFDTDLGRLLYRIIYPDPTVSWTAQQAPPPDPEDGEPDENAGAWYDRTSTNAETLLRDLVNLNAGPGAVSVRREQALTLGAEAGVGISTTVHERFTPLLDALRTVALAGGGVGFDIRQDISAGQSLVFKVYGPQDRSASVHFSPEVGNLSELSATRTAPTGNAMQTAGGGQLKNRAMFEKLDAASIAAWGRREVFRDQRQSGGGSTATEAEQTAAIVEMDKDADEGLADGAEQATITATAIDTPACAYGVHYDLGDRVSAGIDRIGFTVSDIVRAVKITVDEKGVEQVTVTIGTADDDTTSWESAVMDLEKRLSYIERAQ